MDLSPSLPAKRPPFTVLQIIPSLGAGGAEQACVDVAVGLVAAGHRSIVVSSGGPRVAEILKSGVEHILHPVATKNPLRMFLNAIWLSRVIRKQEIDIVHARSRAPAWTAFWANAMIGTMVDCAFMTTVHAAYKFRNPFKKYYNCVMAEGERVIAISDFIASYIEGVYGVSEDRLRTIPRGIDLEKFAPDHVTEARRLALRKSWSIDADDTLLLLPARVTPIKGHNIFIEAVAFLLEKNPNEKIVAVILGDDQGRSQYRNELNQLIEKHGLKKNMRMVPHCNDMPAAYSVANLVVAPSLVPEGFGRVPVEAMVMGIPAIASDLGAFHDTIQHGKNGWLVPAGDARQLALAMRQVLDLTPEQRQAITSKAMIEARALYDKRKMVADTLAVYAELAP